MTIVSRKTTVSFRNSCCVLSPPQPRQQPVWWKTQATRISWRPTAHSYYHYHDDHSVVRRGTWLLQLLFCIWETFLPLGARCHCLHNVLLCLATLDGAKGWAQLCREARTLESRQVGNCFPRTEIFKVCHLCVCRNAYGKWRQRNGLTTCAVCLSDVIDLVPLPPNNGRGDKSPRISNHKSSADKWRDEGAR